MTDWSVLGTLHAVPALDRPDLLGEPVGSAPGVSRAPGALCVRRPFRAGNPTGDVREPERT